VQCVKLQQSTYSSSKLYAKIGCLEGETSTSTKLQMHVYTNNQCTRHYKDGLSRRTHSTNGYIISGNRFSSKVSFRPPFYNCQSCSSDEVAETFDKDNAYWYDDDYISTYGKQRNTDDQQDYANDQADDYANADDLYNADDDQQRELISNFKIPVSLTASGGRLEAYSEEFWSELKGIRRSLENDEDVGDWNMCQRVFHYGVWCDEACLKKGSFQLNEWSKPEVLLLVVMFIFLATMMVLVFVKNQNAYSKPVIYTDDFETAPKEGVSPVVLGAGFFVVIVVIYLLARSNFVNTTLVFTVVVCILLFIFMLKLTLFESRRRLVLNSGFRTPINNEHPID